MGEGGTTPWPEPSLDASKIMEGEASLFNPLFSISWYEHGRTSLPISHVCVNGEVNLWSWLVLRKKRPKRQHVLNFQTTETSQLPFLLWWVKTYNFVYEWNPNCKCRAENPERKEITPLWMNSNSQVCWASSNEYPKKKLVHEKRENY